MAAEGGSHRSGPTVAQFVLRRPDAGEDWLLPASLERLRRKRQRPSRRSAILTPDALRLQHLPIADCARYDSLRRAS